MQFQARPYLHPGSYSTEVVFNGKITTPEALGNITYGYLGTASGFNEFILLNGGDAAANGVSISIEGLGKGLVGAIKNADSAEDKEHIKQGIALYEKGNKK